ncbi:hypothetical protein [Paractinoplanes brasiliensis]|uniref:Uncharacterized protein n=1 Tax=Paractinoplanes brasiliensis TaxID=52695 RepID=A0A4R6JQB3_9ACTN|nr:hypothetical protein [Actinoplanes brasiliensis]TDO37046.1 hypothetical protein C8E87_0641 [Actinoplanes brasiliensis]GID32260.1 hypothetical protein Abr02nite_72430 [Actinoplanes brasiliensis]
MFGMFKRRRDSRLQSGRMHVVTPQAPAVSSQSLIRDALDEIDRHLPDGGPARDALLDVRLKLSPPASSAPSDRADHAECATFRLLGLLLPDSYPTVPPGEPDRLLRQRPPA